MKKRLLCLGLTRSYLDRWIEASKKLNFNLVIADHVEAMSGVPTELHGHFEFIELKSSDRGRILLQMRNENARVPFDGLFTSKDKWLTLIAQLALEFGLPGVNPEIANCFSNKIEMQKLAARAGLRTTRKFADVQQIDSYPVIVKPHDREGSLLVFRCDDIQQAQSAIEKITLQTPDSQIVIEELQAGKEISIEALVLQHKGFVAGITEKFLFRDSFVEKGHISPYLNASAEILARDVVEKIVSSLPDLEFGALHIEGFIRDEQFHIGEIHLRYAGDHIIKLTERAYGVDMITPIFASALGLTPQIPQPQIPTRYFGVSFAANENGKTPASSSDRGPFMLLERMERDHLVTALEL
jgi:biotin carboxylase